MGHRPSICNLHLEDQASRLKFQIARIFWRPTVGDIFLTAGLVENVSVSQCWSVSVPSNAPNAR